MSTSITCIDATHQTYIESYVYEHLPADFLFLDWDEFKARYTQCINMGVEEFHHHLNSAERNLEIVKGEGMWYLYHAMHAAKDFNQIRANEKFRIETIEYAAYLEQEAERKRKLADDAMNTESDDDEDDEFM